MKNENHQKVEELSTFLHVTCHFCGYKEDVEMEDTQLDDMSGTYGLPCPKCHHTMWSEEI